MSSLPDVQKKWSSLNQEKLKIFVIATFDLPDTIANQLWQQILNYDGINFAEELKSHLDGCSDSMSFAFDYLLHDFTSRSWGLLHYVDTKEQSNEEQESIKKFHHHLQTKWTFKTYWKHLQSMLPEMSSHPTKEQKQALEKIFLCTPQ